MPRVGKLATPPPAACFAQNAIHRNHRTRKESTVIAPSIHWRPVVVAAIAAAAITAIRVLAAQYTKG